MTGQLDFRHSHELVQQWWAEALMWWDAHDVTAGRSDRERSDFAFRYVSDSIITELDAKSGREVVHRTPADLFGGSS